MIKNYTYKNQSSFTFFQSEIIYIDLYSRYIKSMAHSFSTYPNKKAVPNFLE